MIYMIFISLTILFFIGLILYQYLLEEEMEGFTDNDIQGINDKLAKLTDRVNTNNTILTQLNTYVNDIVKPNIDIFIEKIPQINAIIENSAEMDDAIEKGQQVANENDDDQ
jgi:hypothetical protein